VFIFYIEQKFVMLLVNCVHDFGTKVSSKLIHIIYSSLHKQLGARRKGAKWPSYWLM